MNAGGSIENSGTIEGGNGQSSAGGAGVAGSGIAIRNSGTIEGGTVSPGGGAQAASLSFLGGANRLTTNGGTLDGDVDLASGSSLTLDQTAASQATGSASYANVFEGAGSLVSTADGGRTVTFLGANTYTGLTTISNGTLQIGDGTSAGNAGRIGQNGTTFSNVATTGGTLALDRTDPAGYTYGGVITGNGTVDQIGGGTTILTGNDASGSEFDGTVNVTAGILSVGGILGDTGNLATATVNVGDGSTANSGTLHGSGTIDATVNVKKGGTISAGNSPGVLATGNLALASGSTFLEEIGGSTATNTSTASYDQVDVTGTVNLGGATLNAQSFGGFTPTVGQTYTIISNDGQDAVVGNFVDANGNALTEGSTVTVNGVALVISYKAGDGNDVTLTDPVPQSSGGGSTVSTTPTSGPDSLTGSAGNDTIAGLAGDDTIDGVGGSDLLLGNQGNDVITDGDGNSTIAGGMDNDRITVGNGSNLLYGDEGADTITAGNGANTIVGGTGNGMLDANDGADSITVGSGSNLVLGNGGNDTIALGGGADTALGGMGNDLITATGSGNDLLYGDEGSDTIQAGNGNNTLVGGSGNSAIDSLDGADFITSGSGNDLIFGNGGDDTVAAGGGADTVLGGYGNDVILGNQGNDVILGNQGDDTLFGGQGADTLVGGQGNDVLYGNEGDDVLYGNEGSNRFVFNPGDTDFMSGRSTGDTVMDFKSGTDKIDFASGPVGTAGNFGATSTTSTDFAAIQTLAQTLINGGDTYAFVADGADGFLFTTGGNGTTIQDAVKLAGAGTATSFKYQDIAHTITT